LQRDHRQGFLQRLFVAILDEAGATAETYTPQLLRLGIENLVLLGDQMQLPPLVKGPSTEVTRSGADQSLMERVCNARPGSVRLLDQQYRMPACLSSIVSDLFYDSRLKTDRAKIEADNNNRIEHLHWYSYSELEERVGTSYCNTGEAAILHNMFTHDGIGCL
jgi:superfamily I DNA and/or RNA helicase